MYSASFKSTNSPKADFLLITLQAKAFARKDYWKSLGHNEESFETTKQELINAGLLMKSGAITAKIKDAYYGRLSMVANSERVEYIKSLVQ